MKVIPFKDNTDELYNFILESVYKIDFIQLANRDNTKEFMYQLYEFAEKNNFKWNFDFMKIYCSLQKL